MLDAFDALEKRDVTVVQAVSECSLPSAPSGSQGFQRKCRALHFAIALVFSVRAGERDPGTLYGSLWKRSYGSENVFHEFCPNFEARASFAALLSSMLLIAQNHLVH
ncbi:unnamed protein product [Ixodes persulcatus]